MYAIVHDSGQCYWEGRNWVDLPEAAWYNSPEEAQAVIDEFLLSAEPNEARQAVDSFMSAVLSALELSAGQVLVPVQRRRPDAAGV